MASKTQSSAQTNRSEPAKDVQMTGVHEPVKLSRDISSLIDSLKKQFCADRCVQIKQKIEENRQKLHGITHHVCTLSKMRNFSTDNDNNVVDLLTRRQEDALNMLNGLELNNAERDNGSGQEDNLQSSTTVLLGSNFGGKNIVRPIKFLEVQKLPPYTTWIFLDRNQRMTEDQSVVGRRRIYYDQTGGEALICSDSEEEIIEEEEEKKEFVDCEDYILRGIQCFLRAAAQSSPKFGLLHS